MIIYIKEWAPGAGSASRKVLVMMINNDNVTYNAKAWAADNDDNDTDDNDVNDNDADEDDIIFVTHIMMLMIMMLLMMILY